MTTTQVQSQYPTQVVSTQALLASRGLRSASELGAKHPHGVRLRYLGGCRCTACRKANSQYANQRAAAQKAGDWNGIVPAAKARAHLVDLSDLGVGRRAVSDITGVADTILMGVINGTRVNIRARSERLILSVTPDGAADGAHIPSGPTWEMLDELIRDGYTKGGLAAMLGRKTRALQLSRRQVTVRNAHEVKCLYERIRCCDAALSSKMLTELKEEGFRMKLIREKVVALAALTHSEVPDLSIRRGRIRMDAAKLIQRVYELLTA